METPPLSTNPETPLTPPAPQPPIPPTPCCSPKIPACRQAGKLLCLSVGLVVLVIVATAAFLLGKYSASTRVRQPFNMRGVPTSAPLATPTENPTANWKTYTSPEKTYTFKYPSLWNISSNKGPIASFVVLQCDECSPESNVDLFQVVPSVYKSTDEYLAKFSPKTDYVKTSLNDLDAVKAVIPGGPQAGGSSLETFVVFKGQGYSISYRFKGLMDKNKLDQLPNPNPDILSTFKFLD